MNILIYNNNFESPLDNYYLHNKYKFTILFLNVLKSDIQQPFRIKIYKEKELLIGSIIVNNLVTKTIFQYLINYKFINIITKSIIESNETFYTFKLTKNFIQTHINQFIKIL